MRLNQLEIGDLKFEIGSGQSAISSQPSAFSRQLWSARPGGLTDLAMRENNIY